MRWIARALDILRPVIYTDIGMKYSTREVAEMLGLRQPNLQRLIREKRIASPPLQKVGRVAVRLWSKRQVEAVRKYLRRLKKG